MIHDLRILLEEVVYYLQIKQMTLDYTIKYLLTKCQLD